METVFISQLKALLDAVAQQMVVFTPTEVGDSFTYARYTHDGEVKAVLNPVRTCSPAKEFLFPMREIAAVFPEAISPEEVQPFAVFGLKDCDLKSIQILDRVFYEEEFHDPFYISRREKMFLISSDCYDPKDTCCCTLFEGRVFPLKGFDLNVSKIKDGYLVEAGSTEGKMFLHRNERLFADAPSAARAERDRNRQQAQQQLEQINARYKLDRKVEEIVLESQDSPVFDQVATGCVECQSCTRICPTCHCFYLFDTQRENAFGKMKVWDSCVRQDFARVAGGENPRKILGDRTKHRLMHKFVYFLERYGIHMCVGCGRCVDSCAGEMDFRDVLVRLNRELVNIKGRS